MNLTGGVWDASRLLATARIHNVPAGTFRNSTLTGSTDELRLNEITGGGDADRIEAVSGDMNDLTIDLAGRVRESIAAVNISRTSIDVDNELLLLRTTGDIRGSQINCGELPSVTIGRNVTASTFTVSGLIGNFTAGNEIINSHIEVTGPAGGITTVTAKNITGSITASAPIGTVSATAGDLDASITTTGPRGDIDTLSASRDLAIRST